MKDGWYYELDEDGLRIPTAGDLDWEKIADPMVFDVGEARGALKSHLTPRFALLTTLDRNQVDTLRLGPVEEVIAAGLSEGQPLRGQDGLLHP